jgi:hypothetical protein
MTPPPTAVTVASTAMPTMSNLSRPDSRAPESANAKTPIRINVVSTMSVAGMTSSWG